MKTRCQIICGSNRDHCFIKNQRQLACIADMIINKVSGISLIIDMARHERNSEKILEILNEASKDVNEIISWVQYLQIAHDLIELSSQFGKVREQEMRRETRYPLPEIYQKYIVITMNLSGSLLPVLITNYSQNGVQFISSEPISVNSVIECILSDRQAIGKGNSFRVNVRYCNKHNDKDFILGARIEDPLDIFRSIHDLALKTVTDKYER